MISGDFVGAAGLVMGFISLGLSMGLHLRQRQIRAREDGELRADMDRSRVECLGEIGRLGGRLEEARRESQASAELLRDGRMSSPVRARAIRMLRTGMSPEKAATELGMARSEVRLLQKVVLTFSRK